MCIIVYKPKNVDFPPFETLNQCFNNNPDGAGYMFPHNNKVVIKKGFMKYKQFKKELKNDIKKYGKDIPYVMHFRISTQAGVRTDCCHPFPLSDKMEDLRKLKTESDFGIAHNGIISLTSDWGGRKTITFSDTMTFITDYLSLIIKNRYYWKDSKTLKLIERLADSKLAIMDNTGRTQLIGDFVKDNGIYYSNSTYKKEKYKYSSYYDWWDYDDKDYSTGSLYDSTFNSEGVVEYDNDSCYDGCLYDLYGDFDDCYYCPNVDKCELFKSIMLEEVDGQVDLENEIEIENEK